MKASPFSDAQMAPIVQQAERDDQTIEAVCRTHGITETNFSRWRKTFGGMTVSEVQRLREREPEHSRRKRLLVERDLEGRSPAGYGGVVMGEQAARLAAVATRQTPGSPPAAQAPSADAATTATGDASPARRDV